MTENLLSHVLTFTVNGMFQVGLTVRIHSIFLIDGIKWHAISRNFGEHLRRIPQMFMINWRDYNVKILGVTSCHVTSRDVL